MTPKEKALSLHNKFYVIGFTGLQRFTEGNMIASDAIQAALIAVENEYHSLREQLFNLKSCGIDIPEKVYLFRIQALIDEEQQVKQEIQSL